MTLICPAIVLRDPLPGAEAAFCSPPACDIQRDFVSDILGLLVTRSLYVRKRYMVQLTKSKGIGFTPGLGCPLARSLGH